MATQIIFKVFKGRKRFDLSSSSFFRLVNTILINKGKRNYCVYSRSKVPCSLHVQVCVCDFSRFGRFCYQITDRFAVLVLVAWFPYDRPDRPYRPSHLKKCSDDRDNHMETLPRRSQTTRTTETTSIAWIELSSIRKIGTIM